MENATKYYTSQDSKAVKGRFFDHKELMIKASEEAKEKIYRTKPYVEIIIAGQSDRFVAPVQENHKERFPDAWLEYMGEAVKTREGTPIEELEGVGEHLGFKLRSRCIATIEDLAVTDPTQLGRIGFGLIEMQKKAQAITGIDPNISPEVEAVKSENDSLKEQMAEMKAMLEALTAEKATKRGRRKKVVTDDSDAA